MAILPGALVRASPLRSRMPLAITFQTTGLAGLLWRCVGQHDRSPLGKTYGGDPWHGRCGFCPGSRLDECASRTAANFDDARAVCEIVNFSPVLPKIPFFLKAEPERNSKPDRRQQKQHYH